jgi:hypothetical protein
MARWIAEGQQLNLIYVDGSHTLGDAMCDLLLADRLLQPGGRLTVDDMVNADSRRSTSGIGGPPTCGSRHFGRPVATRGLCIVVP